MITAESCSTETLIKILEDAYFECEKDSDGDIVVRDSKLIVCIDTNGVYIDFHVFFKIPATTERLELLMKVNSANVKFISPCVSVVLREHEDSSIILQSYLYIGEGVSPKTFIKFLRSIISTSSEVADEIF